MQKTEAVTVDLRWIKTQTVSPGAFDLLDDEERAVAARLPTSARASYIAAHALLRVTLSAWDPRPPASWHFARAEFGKPFVQDSSLRFNLSHSAHYAVVAVSDGAELGVDVEEMDPHRVDDQIAQRMFSTFEYQQWLEANDKVATFFKLWTLKEAYMKATGLGLHLPLQDFSVRLSPPQLIHRKVVASDYHLQTQLIDSATTIALAVKADRGRDLKVSVQDCTL